MKGQTELRKGDIKKAAALVLACLLASYLLHIKWDKAARTERELMRNRVAEAQMRLQAGTEAEKELEQIEQSVEALAAAVREMEEALPRIEDVSSGYGRKILEKAAAGNLRVISLENSEPEHAGGALYRIDYRISLSGDLPGLLGFIESIESAGMDSAASLRLAAAEDGLIRVCITLRAYGVMTDG